jgi:hypothetical protein
VTAEVNVPDEAVDAAITASGIESEDEFDLLKATLGAAAPLIVAADYKKFATELRATLHNLPEYTHGSLAWNLMNAIDAHIEDLRGA